ncbi:MAG: efflux RND transporter permease subunit [candidate division KSB1 bacterium]|nr:efflux RND transporter permease subunit [candidate division KSB1 bacterium]MDZ7357078.1 efflux RND transporter permease subunit [candidate division KSB1 bacterium]
MNIIQFIINRKTFISMLFIGLVLLGYISYQQLPVELFPNAELPFLIVNINGAREMDPAYMEKHAIIPLEGAISTLQGIDKIESFADRRSGRIIVYYNQNVKVKYAYLKLQEMVNSIKPSLGEEFFVNVFKIDTEQLSNMFMSLQVREIVARGDSLASAGGVNRIRQIVDKKITREFENIDGIANVEVFGGQQRSVEIILNEEACRAHQITAAQIRTLIAQNSQNRTFVGKVYERDKQYFVNLVAEYTDVRNLENIVVKREGPILLKDVARVNVGVKEETSISRVNGGEAITMQLVRDTQVNLIELSHTARAVVHRLNKELAPQGIEIVVQSDVAETMEKNLDLIKQLALVGGGLAVLVLWIFLRNLRLVFVIALAIPISLFTAFNFFYAAGISINSLTLVGMALAIGMLLDNSVVVLENIYRLVSDRKEIDQSVIQGTREVWRSIFAATLTTVAVFLPFIFSSDFLVRLIGRHIGVSIISTLLISLVVALLLVPMVTHFFLMRGKKADVSSLHFNVISPKNRLLQIYRVLLKATMRFPARTVVLAFVLFLVSLLIALALSINVSQEVETKEFNLYVTMPRGSTLQATDQVVAELEQRLSDIDEKQDIVSNISEEEAIITIKLKEGFEKIKNRTVAQVKSEIQNRIRDYRAADVSFEQPAASQRFRGGMRSNPGANLERMLGIGSQTEKVVIKGRDFNTMRNLATDIRNYLEDLSSMNRVSLNIADDRPEIHLLFDTELLSHYNISLNTIASELAGFQSEFSSGLKYKQGSDEYDIVIRNENLEEKTIDDLRTLRIPSPNGGSYELEQLSRIVYSAGMSGINRVNQEKQIEVTYQFLDEVNKSKPLLEASRAEVDQLIASLNIPPGVAVEVIHDETELGEYKFLIVAALILIFMILASVFESAWQPFVILFSIPLASIGAFWALIFTGNSILNANTLTGFLILLGVVVNNGIILIDYTRILRQRGYHRARALMMAGQARVRPILITAITTIVGMLPLAMGKAEYVTRIGAPFAITVIGGLAAGTLFTLVFIPTVYSGLETALQWIRSLNWKIKLVQLAIALIGFFLIYFYVDSLLWKIVELVLLVMLVPAATYFIMISLRQAKAEIIQPGEALRIKIQHLVKIYEQEMRFVREWKKGLRIRAKAGLLRDYRTWRDFDDFIYLLPALGFLIYFVYFYLRSGFWVFVTAHLVYFYVLALWKPIRIYLRHRLEQEHNQFLQLVAQWFYPIFFWGFPLLNLVIFYFKWHKITILIFIAVIWYFGLAVYTTSNRLQREEINIMRLTGKFAGLRKNFYRLVQAIPIIGKKKQPFKALDGVSLEIGSGMFGLLGPNGAGKTTLMRIICGILEQSRGSIWINDIDLKEKREELQGLIGYLPQEFGTYENMTAYEFLSYQAILKNIYDQEERERRVNYCLAAVHLEKNKHQKIGSFSGGMKQRIGIAQTLLHLPRILVVDEPTAGLDPRERIRFRNLLVELSRERIVIFSTHIIEDISSSCNKVAVLNKGRLCYLGDPQEMARLADGFVWQFQVPAEQFEAVSKDLWIVHHIRDGESIRARCIATERPTPNAQEVRPTLEDAYLWLLRQSGC